MSANGGSSASSENETSMTLESDRVIVIARAFNGPARIVFAAVTRADLVRRWWAPTSLGDSAVSFEADVRVGGRYRYVIRSSEGNAVAFSGRYVEVTPPSRLIYTQHFEPTASGPMPGAEELVVTVTLDERDGKTHMVQHILCPSKEVRDVILASGMEHGMRITMDQLDELVASLASEEANSK